MPGSYIQPIGGVQELGLSEIIGINDTAVDQNDYSKSVSVDISSGGGQPVSGCIEAFAFYQTEDAGGAILSPAGTLYVLGADPEVASGDTALAAAEWPTVLGAVDVAATDWKTDATGSVAHITDTPVWFHPLATLYFVFKLTSATSINSAAGDDEQLEFNAWLVRYS